MDSLPCLAFSSLVFSYLFLSLFMAFSFDELVSKFYVVEHEWGPQMDPFLFRTHQYRRSTNVRPSKASSFSGKPSRLSAISKILPHFEGTKKRPKMNPFILLSSTPWFVMYGRSGEERKVSDLQKSFVSLMSFFFPPSRRSQDEHIHCGGSTAVFHRVPSGFWIQLDLGSRVKPLNQADGLQSW